MDLLWEPMSGGTVLTVRRVQNHNASNGNAKAIPPRDWSSVCRATSAA